MTTIGASAAPLNKFAGFGVAVFLLALIAGESLTAVSAFGNSFPIAASAHKPPVAVSETVEFPKAIPEGRGGRRQLADSPQAVDSALPNHPGI